MFDPCPGCGVRFHVHAGPTHRYIGASAACWALYSALLAGQPPLEELLSDSVVDSRTIGVSAHAAPAGVEALLIDAYAAQHHGEPSPQAIQSVAVHLLVLHGVFRVGVAPTQALWLRRRALRQRGVFHWLTPPPPGTALSLRHLFPGGGVAAVYSVAEYVASVHAAWEAAHGEQLATWYSAYIVSDR